VDSERKSRRESQTITRENYTVTECLIAAESYRSGLRNKRIGKRQKVMVPFSLRRSRGWYDVTVEAEAFNFLVRYAGHLETGSAGLV